MSITMEEVNITSSCDIGESLKTKIMNIYLASEKRKEYNRILRELYRHQRRINVNLQ